VSAPPVAIVTPRGKLIGLAVVCALFTAMGAVVLAVNPTETLNLVVGVAAMAFFGLGGGFSLASQWRRSTILSADDAGVHVRGASRRADVTLAWADVERFGADTTHLGLRLRDPAVLVAADPEAYARDALRATRSRTGWDLTWPAPVLGRSPKEAASVLQARRPR
jgi:hypothetical protein